MHRCSYFICKWCTTNVSDDDDDDEAMLLHVLHVVACNNVPDCVFLKDDLNRV